MGEILPGIFGGNFPGDGAGLDDILGGGAGNGDAADDLLNSMEGSLRDR